MCRIFLGQRALYSRSLLALLLILTHSCLIAQHVSSNNRTIDSLVTRLDRISSRAEKIPVYVELIRKLYTYDMQDLIKSLKYGEELYKLAQQEGDSATMVWAGRALGQIYNRLEKPREALSILEPVLLIARRNNLTDEEKKILNNLGIAFTYLANYDKALEYHYQALALREKDGDASDVAATLNNIGLTYFKLHNYAKALEFYQLALAKRLESGITEYLEQQYANIGLCYNHLKEYDKAFESFQKALELCKSGCADRLMISLKYGLGVTELHTQKYRDAEIHFKESLKLAQESQNMRYASENYLMLARLMMAQNMPAEARQYLQQAERIALENNIDEVLVNVYLQYSRLFTALQDFENKAFYQEKYIQLKDSIFNEELIDRIARIQTDFAEREHLAIIASKEEVIRRQRMLNFAIGIIAVLAVLMLFILFRSNQVIRKVNQALSRTKAELEQLNRDLDHKVQEKTASLEKVNRELDHFIYKTSHDIRGPLSTLRGITNVALLDVKDPAAVAYFKKLDETAGKLNRVLSRLLIVNQVNQAVINPEPININSLVDDIIAQEVKNGLPPRLRIIKEIPRDLVFYSDRHLLGIILSNLIDNAIKFHVNTDRVEPFVKITVAEQDDNLHIHVVDNGMGLSENDREKIFQLFFRGSERSETGGVGLYLCRIATERLGGEIGVWVTGSDRYTDFYLILPISEKAEAVT